MLVILGSWVSPSFSSTLTVQFTSEPTQFDPLLMEDGTALKICANTIGTLFAYDSKGDRWKSLVEDYSLSRDRKKYTFRFRKNLKWSDGKLFHADHFILALNRLAKEAVKPSLSDLFPKFNLKLTRATNARTAEVVLEEADEQFLNWLTLPPFAPIRPDIVDSYSEKRTPVVPTLGAYEVLEYKREEYLKLRKNPEYFQSNQVEIDEVKIRFITDEGALMPLLKSGAVDILNRVPVLQLKPIQEIAKVDEVPVEAVTYLAFNKKLNRQTFRDAMHFGKRLELAQLLKTGELPAMILIPRILTPPSFTRERGSALNKSELKLDFSLQSDTGSRNQSILEFTQSVVKTDLKWTAELDLLDFKTHYSKLKSDPDAVYRFGWQNPVSAPFIMYQAFTSKSPNNFTGWSHPRFDSLVAELRQETRKVKQSKLINQLEDVLWEEAPVVPLLHQVLRFAYSKRVLGFRANSFGVILFRELRLNEGNAKPNTP